MLIMRTHAEIVGAAGKPEEVALRRAVSVHTVRSWIQRDSIPAEHWAAFARDGVTTTDELAQAAEAKRLAGEAAAA
jgi:hypothetical protein